MYSTQKSLILASGSPRRQEFFTQLGLDFKVLVSEIDESPKKGEAPEQYVQRLAQGKAVASGKKSPSMWVVGADTIVCIGEKLLGKPQNAESAVAMLLVLSGKRHKVVTAFCLYSQENDICDIQAVTTFVTFTSFSKKMAENYVATGEPMDKAGSYGIQGIGGAFVEKIEGSYSSVVGLPLVELVSCLLKHGVIDQA